MYDRDFNARQIVEGLAREHYITHIITMISKETIPKEDREDLEGYILEYLLTHPDTVERMNRERKLKFYLWGVIKRQCNSNTSWYAVHLRKWQRNRLPFPNMRDDDEDNEED